MNKRLEKEFRGLPLTAYNLLTDAPLRSLDKLQLSGGRKGMTLPEIKETIGFNTGNLEVGIIPKSLFWLRGAIGRIIWWDNTDAAAQTTTYLNQIPPELRALSLIPPGQEEGISR
jgi:hypothetical protein